MKVILITLSLMVNFQNVLATTDIAGQFKLSEKECHNLAKELSDDAFETEKELNSKKLSERFSDQTMDYLDQSRMSFSKTLHQLCDKKKDSVTFDLFYKEESTCKEICNENLIHIKKPIFKVVEDLNRTETKSEAACNVICYKNQIKLDAMKRGLAMAMKTQVSSDCTGVVSNSGRSKSKTSDLEQVVKEAKKSLQK